MSRPTQPGPSIWQRLGAGAALLAVLVGFPLVMSLLVGWPLPSSMPIADSLRDVATEQLAARTIVNVLAVGAWLAWAHFVVCLLAEVRGAQTGRQLRVPFGGVNQQVAGKLVASLLLTVTVSASTGITPATAAPAHEGGRSSATSQLLTAELDVADSSAGSVAVTATEPPRPAAGVSDTASGLRLYTVQPPQQGYADNLWDISERYLGDGTRWQEVFGLNKGRQQPTGGSLTDAGQLRPGWQLLMPSDAIELPPAETDAPAAAQEQAATDVTVEPGDTLWGIAEEQLGDGQRYDEIAAASAGPQPDGGRLTDPDLIRPGWVLTLPGTSPDGVASPDQPPAPSVTLASPQPDAPPVERSQEAPAVAPVQPDDPASATAAAPPARPEARTPDVPRTAAAGEGSAVDDPDADVDVDAADDSEGEGLALSAVAFAGGGTLATVLLGALVAMRRQRFRERRPGATIGTTPPELAAMEKALLTGNAQAVADVQFLHDALASLLRTLDGAELPDVVAVRLSAEVMELVQSAERRDAPEPWRVDETGLRWTISTDADLSSAGEAAPAELAPYPALVTVGYTDAGEHWLVDLERVGAVSLTGDPERCLDLARYVAAELAHNRWSEQLQVSVVGFGAELAELNPSRILYRPNAAVAVAGLRATLSEHSQVLAESSSTVLAGRARLDLPGDGWAPHVLLVAPDAAAGEGDPAELVALLEAMRAQRSRAAVAIVLAGDEKHADGTRWTLHVDETGRLSMPALGVELIAHRLPAPEALQLGELLARTAAAPDVSAAPARGDQPWDALADAAGAPLHELTEQRPADERALKAAEDPDDHVDPVASVLPMPAATYVSVTATTSGDVAQLAPGVGAAVRRRVEKADPDLDADLAAWHDPDSGIAKLALLGPVSLVGAGPAPAKRAAFLTEMVGYLAARPQGVSPAQLSADFWPGAEDTGTGRKMISKVRTWLGRDPRTGALYVPMARDAGAFGSYGVQGLPVDGDLFRRLRLRGVTRGPEGISDLWSALELVRGVPLLELQAKGSGWLVDTPLHYEYTASIVDVAHLVATHHLAAGEPAEAERVARVALLAGAPDDVTLLDLVAACDADGRHAEADSHVRQILANNEVDIVEELQPRTFEVLRRRNYLPQQPARAEAGA